MMTNKPLAIITAIITCLSSASYVVHAQVSTQNASPSADLDLEVIKENVKRRIQEVVNIKGDIDTNTPPIAYMGILTSIANLTLTIDSNDGIKLASTSAETNFIALPNNDSLDYVDLSLDDYVVALGYVDEALVLDTKRVIIEDEPLQNPPTGSYYGLTIPSDEEDILIQNPQTNQQFSCNTTRSTIYESIDNDVRVSIDLKDLLPLTPTLIIYEPDEDKPETLYCKSLLQHTSAPSPNLNLNTASPSAQTPPELQ